MGKLLHFPCDDDPKEPEQEQYVVGPHEFEIVVNADNHPVEIVCSCGATFNVSEVWGED